MQPKRNTFIKKNNNSGSIYNLSFRKTCDVFSTNQKHFVSVRVLIGNSRHFQVGNWGKFNEGTIFSGVKVKGKQKGMVSILRLATQRTMTPFRPQDQGREQLLGSECISSCQRGHLQEPWLDRGTQPTFRNQKGRSWRKTPDLTLHLVFLFAESGTPRWGEE